MDEGWVFFLKIFLRPLRWLLTLTSCPAPVKTARGVPGYVLWDFLCGQAPPQHMYSGYWGIIWKSDRR